MSKTQSNVLTVFKVAAIFFKVIFILCLVGVGGCLLGLVTMPIVGALPKELKSGQSVDVASACFACAVGLVTCAGESAFAFLAERYSKNVLAANTPFTESGAKECFRLGIASLIISLGVSFVGGMLYGIFSFAISSVSNLDLDLSVSLTTGLFLLFRIQVPPKATASTAVQT